VAGVNVNLDQREETVEATGAGLFPYPAVA